MTSRNFSVDNYHTQGIRTTIDIRAQGRIPIKGSKDAAAFDLRSDMETVIPPGKVIKVTTGFKMQLPRGRAGLVLSRSGLAAKHGVFVANAPGLIDSDYTGDVSVLLYNSSDVPFKVEVDDRIAQLMIVNFCESAFFVSNFEETERGEGGFGSTGSK